MQLEDYTYEIDPNNSDKIWFTLNHFPGIKFNYIDVVVGDEQPDTSVDIRFNIEVKVQAIREDILKQQSESDEFRNYVRELLQDLIMAMVSNIERNSEENN